MQFKKLNWPSLGLNKTLSLFGLMSLVLLTNCREAEDVVGTEYVVAPSDMEVLEFNGPATVNFKEDSAVFSGQLSHRVTWFIDFKGLESGAEARIEGLSQTIDPVEAFWDGSHDDLKFFRQGETVQATISFLKSNVSKTVTFNIADTKKFMGDVLFEGFDKLKSFYAWPEYLIFSDYDDKGFVSESEKVVQGTNSFQLQGTDAGGGYFIGGVRAYSTSGYFAFDSYSPDSVYFNCYIYGDGNPNTRVSIAVAEDDDLNGTYEDASNDVWEFPVKITWSGWKLVSTKYSSFTRATEPAYGGSGNGKQELDRVKQVTFNLLSDPAGNTAGYLIDYPVITYGEPFNPKK